MPAYISDDYILPSIQGPTGNAGDETSTASVEENSNQMYVKKCLILLRFP